MDYVFSCCFRLSSLNRRMVRRAFSDVLNRCERVIVQQTQDRYFSKMGCHTTSLQGRMYSKRVVARYFFCSGNLKFCMQIESLDLNQSFAFPENSVLSKKSIPFPQTHSFPFGNISPTCEKVGQNMGRRGAAPYLYTRSVYKYATLRVNRPLAPQAFIGKAAIKE